MPRPAGEADKPAFRPVGDLTTVDGVLAYLNVTEKSKIVQKRAIVKSLKNAVLRDHVRKLGPELAERGLI